MASKSLEPKAHFTCLTFLVLLCHFPGLPHLLCAALGMAIRASYMLGKGTLPSVLAQNCLFFYFASYLLRVCVCACLLARILVFLCVVNLLVNFLFSLLIFQDAATWVLRLVRQVPLPAEPSYSKKKKKFPFKVKVSVISLAGLELGM